jgi:hypothetical protein
MAASVPEMAQQLHYVLDILVSPKEGIFKGSAPPPYTAV